MRPACRWTHTALPRWVIERRLAAFAARQRKAPLVQRGGQHGNAMQGGLQSRGNDSAGFLLSGAGAPLGRPDTGPGAPLGCGGSPSIPQSAFADSSLCTREPSLPFCIEPAQRGTLVRCPDGHTLFAAQHSPGHSVIAQRGSAVCQRRHSAYMYSKKASRALFT